VTESFDEPTEGAGHERPPSVRGWLRLVSPRRRLSAAAKLPVAGADEGPRRAMQVFLQPLTRKRLRMWAALLDRDMSDIIERAVLAQLDDWDRERAAKGLPPITLE
jgi:hypothetical protein